MDTSTKTPCQHCKNIHNAVHFAGECSEHDCTRCADERRTRPLAVAPNMLPVIYELKRRMGEVHATTRPAVVSYLTSEDANYLGGIAMADSQLKVPSTWVSHLIAPVADRWGIEHSLTRLERPERRELGERMQRILDAFHGHWEFGVELALAELYCLGAPTEFLALHHAIRWLSYDFCKPDLRAVLTPIALETCSQRYLDAQRGAT
jgi:hypothetical protein